MSFVSYAQNFEDVMLWRALNHIEQGFYIDIGAWSPDIDSVTRAFYERGWRGINVEPSPEYHQQLEASRPLDINLQVAIGDAECIMTMNFLANPGLSTLNDAIAQQHQANGLEVSRHEVEVKTLAAIWQQHVPDGRSAHFLKVDVEGLEAAVLRGNDWTRYRPWVVVVEATLPMSQVESHEDWEPALLKAGYQFAYADGLNRFYVAEEHADLLPAFKYPPNVFDGYVLATHQQAEAKAEQAEAKAEQAEAKAEQAEAKAEQAEAASNQLLMQLHAVYNSKSWRITAPLRRVNATLHRFKPRHILRKVGALLRWFNPRQIKPKIRLIVQHAALYIGRRPGLKRLVVAMLNRLPGLKTRLMRVTLVTRAPLSPKIPGELTQLSPRARQIYADLKTATKKNKRAAV